jgi:hypothetical protein
MPDRGAAGSTGAPLSLLGGKLLMVKRSINIY